MIPWIEDCIVVKATYKNEKGDLSTDSISSHLIVLAYRLYIAITQNDYLDIYNNNNKKN